MRICAPFVCSMALGLARSVPPAFAQRMATDSAFYDVLARRCHQHVRRRDAAAASAAASVLGRTRNPVRSVGASRDGQVMRRGVARAPPKATIGVTKQAMSAANLLHLEASSAATGMASSKSSSRIIHLPSAYGPSGDDFASGYDEPQGFCYQTLPKSSSCYF